MANILVVEDDDAFREVLETLLLQENHKVVTASNGALAISLARERVFDLVITDLLMPEKEGLETIRELRQLRPDLKIIAMSGGGRIKAGDFLSIARKFGAAHSLEKPFSRDVLIATIKAALTP